MICPAGAVLYVLMLFHPETGLLYREVEACSEKSCNKMREVVMRQQNAAAQRLANYRLRPREEDFQCTPR